jgi:hypothetical protein
MLLDSEYSNVHNVLAAETGNTKQTPQNHFKQLFEGHHEREANSGAFM